MTGSGHLAISSRWKRRSWWLPLGLALVGFYLSVSFLLVIIGRELEVDGPDNAVLDAALFIAPFNFKAREAKAAWLRSYAMTLEPEERAQPMQKVIVLIEPATKWRPRWPYYHLALLDAEFHIDGPAEALQARFDTLFSLAPNERGLDSYMVEVAVKSWSKLRPDQKELIGAKLTRSKSYILDPLLEIIEEELYYSPELCDELPFAIVEAFCAPESE